jgi:hypothetical protein
LRLAPLWEEEEEEKLCRDILVACEWMKPTRQFLLPRRSCAVAKNRERKERKANPEPQGRAKTFTGQK